MTPAKRSDILKRIGQVVVVGSALTLVAVIIFGYATKPGWMGVAHKTVWDYLELLIVPAVLVLGGFWLNKAQSDLNRETENQRAEDAALQAFLDQMTQLLLDKHDDQLVMMTLNDDVRQVIQARSEFLLRNLNATRKWHLILFLAVMGLLEKERPTISLVGADLKSVDGQGAPLEKIHLARANLSNANLSEAKLNEADLQGTNLRQATLLGADLQDANLREADLRGADLREITLFGADLLEADLLGADVRGADLRGATNLTKDQIEWTVGNDKTTMLPSSLHSPEVWKKRVREQHIIIGKQVK